MIYGELLCGDARSREARRSLGGRERGSKGGQMISRQWGRNPVIIATESMIREELAPDFEEQLHEREGDAGKWPNKKMNPEYGVLRRGKIRKTRIEA